jgi:hypothetical protein
MSRSRKETIITTVIALGLLLFGLYGAYQKEEAHLKRLDETEAALIKRIDSLEKSIDNELKLQTEKLIAIKIETMDLNRRLNHNKAFPKEGNYNAKGVFDWTQFRVIKDK